MAATDNAGFSISFPCSQWDTAQYSYIYIRLRGEKENKKYYSNVLRYAAYNMEAAEDLGDSLGGDTSIVNPPENPEEDSTDKPSGDQKPSDNPKPSEDQKPSNDNKPSDDGKSLDKDSGKHEGDNSDTNTSGDSQSSNTDVLNDSAGFPDNIAATEPITDPAGEHDAGNTVLNTNPIENANSHTDNNKNQNTEGNRNPSVNETGADVVQTETETMDVMSKELAAAAQEGTDGDAGLHQPMTVKQKIDKTRNIVLILGLITLSAGVGVAAYFIHAGRNPQKQAENGQALPKRAVVKGNNRCRLGKVKEEAHMDQKRLEAFEKMLAAVQKEYADMISSMNKMKADGESKDGNLSAVDGAQADVSEYAFFVSDLWVGGRIRVMFVICINSI